MIMKISYNQDALHQQKISKQTTKGLVLYEQVLQKNFEIIETFLNKFPLIFKKQDFFEDSIKKINEKLNKHDTDHEKLKEDLQLSTAMLEKKIANARDGTLRSNGSSQRVSQDLTHLEERKNNSVFRISAIIKDPKDFNAHISKQKMEMLAEVDKKQQQHLKKINELQQTIQTLKQKINFLSVLNSDLQSKMDHLIQAKVDINQFQQLSKQYEIKFQKMINLLVNQKYHLGGKLIKEQVIIMETNINKYIHHLSTQTRKQFISEIQKKAGINQFTDQLGDIKTVIQKMVDQSVQSFASKQETKKALQLFQKKFVKLEVIMQQLLAESMKGVAEEQIKQCMSLGCQKEREGVMSSFGRRRRPCTQK